MLYLQVQYQGKPHRVAFNCEPEDAYFWESGSEVLAEHAANTFSKELKRPVTVTKDGTLPLVTRDDVKEER